MATPGVAVDLPWQTIPLHDGPQARPGAAATAAEAPGLACQPSVREGRLLFRRRRFPAAWCQPMLQAVEIQIDHRRGVEC